MKISSVVLLSTMGLAASGSLGAAVGTYLTNKPLVEVNDSIAQLDVNNDSVISTEEWKPFVASYIDQDHNGSLSMREISDAMKTAKMLQRGSSIRRQNLEESSKNLSWVVTNDVPFDYNSKRDFRQTVSELLTINPESYTTTWSSKQW